MARLQADLLERAEAFCDRALDVADHLREAGRPPRIVSQLIGCGSSVGANLFEADEAMSRADFCRCLAICINELNETRFWLRLIQRRNWIAGERLAPLETEAEELKRILGSMLARTRAHPRPASSES